MKFYFCEGCGRRITEKDIAAGEGRDKKLKGVYCSECAIGITTMETMPLTEDQARGVLEKEDPGRNKRRTSRSAIPPAAGKVRARKSSKAELPAPQRPSGMNPLLLGGLAVAVVGVLLVVALWPSPEKPTIKKASNKRGSKSTSSGDETASTTRSTSESNESGRSPAGPKTSGTRQTRKQGSNIADRKSDSRSDAGKSIRTRRPEPEPPPKPSADELAKAARTALESRLDAIGSEDTARRIGLIEAFLKEHGETASAAPVKERLVGERARLKFSKALRSFDEALGAGRFEEALKKTGKTEGIPELKAYAVQLQGMKAVAEALLRGKRSEEKAREALIDGKVRSIATSKGTIKGIIRKLEGETLHVTVKGRINNQEIEYGKRLGLTDLLPKARAELLGEKKPDTPDEWIGRAVQRIVKKDLDGAAKALDAAGAHPLTAHYRHRLDVLRLGEREVAAGRCWQDRIAPLLTVGEFKEKAAKNGLGDLEAFRDVHGKTKLAASKRGELDALEKKLRLALGIAKEMTLDLGQGVSLKFVLIPAGSVVIGEPGKSGDVHCRVTISKPFYMGMFEVTRQQYELVVGGKLKARKYRGYPATNANWFECQRFCEKASAKTKRTIRLPTDAEWELACRAGTTTRYYFGDSEEKKDEYGWFQGNSRNSSHPVGEKKPNAFGLHDMHGNVWEWCQDFFAPVTQKTATDPKGPASGAHRVRRGGSWRRPVENALACRRGNLSPTTRRPDHGFRVAMDP